MGARQGGIFSTDRQSSIHRRRSFRKPSLGWILHITDRWLYSISDHCFNDLTNYRQDCYSSSIFLEGDIPEVLKIGLLSPIFKNKGSKNDAINYRGITVLPVISKIIEAVIRGHRFCFLCF
jgi:hypothetical protein